ncbi:cytochrome c [Thioalkalivibrio sp. ALR17-21]|uniref:c-type cytochrome n=1 Tax=Thioalkalivibrio sp. ALR17-21 TaxID=1269813 RepID=UPI0004625BFC|nr:c-type cytochrome [Thioalkalivibrio sp. ALR17-21]
MTNQQLAGGLALILGFGMGASTAQAVDGLEGDPQRGEGLTQTCVSCHQADGSGQNVPGGESWPRLAGLPEGYIARQLKDYQEGRRDSSTMAPFANLLDDQGIADVAAYYARLPVTEAQGGDDVDDATLARGEELALRGDWNQYIVSCQSCHGPGNAGAGEVFPGIASQHAGYIADQLHHWQEGERANDPQGLMAAIARRMSDEDVRAVSAWLARQRVTSE